MKQVKSVSTYAIFSISLISATVIFADPVLNNTDNGLVAFVGNHENQGYIKADFGNVVLASGNKFTLDFEGNHLINFTVNEPNEPASSGGGANASNSGVIADGGQVLMSTQTASAVLDNTINMTGITQARSISRQNGEIILEANEGVIRVASKLDASGNASGVHGDSVALIGKHIDPNSDSHIDVSGNAGGGVITLASIIRTASYVARSSNNAVGSQVTVSGVQITPAPFAVIHAHGNNAAGRQIVLGDNPVLTLSTHTTALATNWGSAVDASSATSKFSGGDQTVVSGDRVRIGGTMTATGLKVISDNAPTMPFARFNMMDKSGDGDVAITSP